MHKKLKKSYYGTTNLRKRAKTRVRVVTDIQNFALRAHCVGTACALRAWHSLSLLHGGRVAFISPNMRRDMVPWSIKRVIDLPLNAKWHEMQQNTHALVQLLGPPRHIFLTKPQSHSCPNKCSMCALYHPYTSSHTTVVTIIAHRVQRVSQFLRHIEEILQDPTAKGLVYGGILALRARCALLLEKVLPKEPPGTPLPNAPKLGSPKLP